MAQGSTQSVTEMITRVISWGGRGGGRGVKGGRWVRLTTWPPLCAACLEILGASNFWSHKDLSKTVMKQLSYYFIFKKYGNNLTTLVHTTSGVPLTCSSYHRRLWLWRSFTFDQSEVFVLCTSIERVNILKHIRTYLLNLVIYVLTFLLTSTLYFCFNQNLNKTLI
jgi:hypothetical protein